MSEFIFFRKGTQIFAVEKGNAEGSSHLEAQGYEQEFEEITAPDAQSALARYNDIKKEDELNVYAFALGPTFTLLIVVVLTTVAYVVMK